MSEQDELLNEFLIESNETLDRLDEELVTLETEPNNKELLNSIFRRIHTIKGVCGFLDFSILESVTHAGENLLQTLRNGEIVVNEQIATLLLNLCDAVRSMLKTIETTGGEGLERYQELVEALVFAAEKRDSPRSSTPTSLDDEFEAILAQRELDAMPPAETSDHNTEEMQPLVSEVSSATQAATVPPTTSSAATFSKPPNEPGGLEALDTSKHAAMETTLRVDVDLLDHLMNLAGELVLARNQILQTTKSRTDIAFRNITQRLSLVTSELQEGVMKTRMQQIATVWTKFPRVVRDLARTCHKQVRLEMEGKDTELDKTIIEAIKDPLTHIVRNSIDHGIELPDLREVAGKPAEGCISLRAFHEGGYVIIEIADDGGGLNTEKIRARALERGLISSERAQTMSENEIHRLIFAPGFSTAETVTNISGRGVGMDVVKSNIERIGGQVDITSNWGLGSTIRLKIPLTLAIIPTLLVSSGSQKFAIPQVSITELVQMRSTSNEQNKDLSWLGNTPVYRLRGNLLPLLFLDRQLQVCSPDSPTAIEDKIIVVVKVDNCRFGIVVDSVYDTEEIVVKPLGRQLKNVPVFAGATILGDGQIALIIDIAALGKRSGVYQEAQRAEEKRLAAEASQSTTKDNLQLLVVQVSEEYRAAIPLEAVNRLEEIPQSELERLGSQMVVQYRGSILPVVDVCKLLKLPELHGETMQIVVVGAGSVLMGLRVQRIMDVSNEISAVKAVKGHTGLRMIGVINKKVTAVLDVDQLLSQSALSETLGHGEGATTL
jgi:two-component system chemotaxis sensor kinase CheA